MKQNSLKDIKYTYRKRNKNVRNLQKVIGIDTEADESGRCFMLAVSTGYVFPIEEFPQCLFNREHRDKTYVAYNLKYDEGALLQWLPLEKLQELRDNVKIEYNGYIITSIPGKLLSIKKDKHSIHIYDMLGFYGGSLDYNAKKYLGRQKIDIETKTFSIAYIETNYIKIAYYCYIDAVLVAELGMLMIHNFNNMGVVVNKLYSTAYISATYFSSKCSIPDITNMIRDNYNAVDYALQSYAGGKFEISEKGVGYYYEYDIVSAYPSIIRELVDIENSRIIQSNKYRRNAVYGFIQCTIIIEKDIYSPVPIQHHGINIFPIGSITKVITKIEYEYLVSIGVNITIHNAYWFHVDNKKYIFKKEIDNLMVFKRQYKAENKPVLYKITKLILNSFYGKLIQLIKKHDKYTAGTLFNPIYASHITASIRVQVTKMQNDYADVIAVHTDSLISKKPLPIKLGKELGNWDFEIEGKGLIIGCGIYQIADKVRFRGASKNLDLFTFLNQNSSTLKFSRKRAKTWKEVAFRGLPISEINRFFDDIKTLRPNFDSKRIWPNDYQKFSELFERPLYSVPLIYPIL